MAGTFYSWITRWTMTRSQKSMIGFDTDGNPFHLGQRTLSTQFSLTNNETLSCFARKTVVSQSGYLFLMVPLTFIRSAHREGKMQRILAAYPASRTTRLTSDTNDFLNAKSHVRKKPLLAGCIFTSRNWIFNCPLRRQKKKGHCFQANIYFKVR